MRGRREEESVYALGGVTSASAARAGAGDALGRSGPRIAQYRVAVPGQKVKMHVDSTQVSSCLNPVHGVRDAQARAGVKPTDHARQNYLAVKERSRLNALRRLSREEEEDQDAAPRRGGAQQHAGTARSGGASDRGAVAGAPGRARSLGSAARRQSSGGAAGGGGGGSLSRDFVEENRLAAAAARHPAKAEARVEDAAAYMRKREYGQVPTYLVERKLQMAEERRALEEARQAARVPPGMRVMPEEERLETLGLLERNRAEVEAALAAMPIVIETHSQRRHKDKLEQRLAEIEEARRVFGRKHVLVRI